MTSKSTIDVRIIPGPQRHPLIFRCFETLQPGEAIELVKGEDPDPHGMTWHEGSLYYCDAGIAPGHKDSGSKSAGYICRIHV